MSDQMGMLSEIAAPKNLGRIFWETVPMSPWKKRQVPKIVNPMKSKIPLNGIPIPKTLSATLEMPKPSNNIPVVSSRLFNAISFCF